MHILVINSGSSSIKFSLFNTPSPGPDPNSAAPDPQSLLEGELSNIGTPDASLQLPGGSSPVQAATPADAIHLVLDAITQPGNPVFDAIGYRVVHPGPTLHDHQRITPQVLAALKSAIPFAPLHDPEAIDLIRATMARFPDLPHFACFDTVFHRTMPPEATTYPIPLAFRDLGVRRYGFHGLSCESVVHQLRAAPGLAFPQRLLIAHLGSGSSVTAVLDGHSIDTSMGLTPTGGVVMGTRPGDLDPGLVFFLLRQPGASIESVESMLNHESGLKALFGTGDMRKLHEAPAGPSPVADRACLAFAIFTASVRRALGGMAALHGVDALVFTGGIGEHDPIARDAIAGGLLNGQPLLDPTLNTADVHGLRSVSATTSALPVFVVPAEEDLMIAIHVARMHASQQQVPPT